VAEEKPEVTAMKSPRTLASGAAVGLWLCGALAGWAAEVEVGDTEAMVREALGPPMEYVRIGEESLLTYDRGKVELRDGKVTAVALVSAEEARAMRLQRKQEQNERTAVLAEQRRERISAGTALKERKLADPAFLAAPGSEQVAFWNGFRQSYPEVDIAAEYAQALARWQQEQDAAEQRERVAALERRVAAAEQRAREAELTAARAAAEGISVYATHYTPYVVYPVRGYVYLAPMPGYVKKNKPLAAPKENR
jgi:hypothetical protein